MEQLQSKEIIEQAPAIDPLATRKKLAVMFESFLVQRMQQGQVEPDAAKDTAKHFVEIFQNATSLEAQHEAIETLSKDGNPLLHSFALRVQEMNEVQVKHNLYQFMLTVAQNGGIAEARALYQLFDRGEIHDNASLQTAITARQNSMILRQSAQSLKLALEQNKQPAAAAQLEQLIQAGNIATQADLDQWQALIPGYTPQKSVSIATKQPVELQAARPATIPTKDMSQLRRLWEGVHRFDQQLRRLLHLDN